MAKLIEETLQTATLIDMLTRHFEAEAARAAQHLSTEEGRQRVGTANQMKSLVSILDQRLSDATKKLDKLEGGNP